MSLQIININNDLSPEKSLIGIGNSFNIELFKNSFYERNFQWWRLGEHCHTQGLWGFKGVTTENVSLNFSTTWEDAGGAKLGKAIQSKIQGKIFKALAAQSPAGYMPFILTDAWTQQKASGTSPIKCDLKFKLYNDNSVAGTNYHDVILFLTHICSPIKPIQFGTDGVNLVKNALEGFGVVGQQIIGGVKSSFGNGNGIAGSVACVVNNANDLYTDLTLNASDGINNGNFTVLFTLGDKIHNNTSSTSKIKYVDWIVQNFTFTPSTQFVWDENKELPMPLWCDFTVSLETRLSLSNKYVYDVLNDNPIDINYIQ